MSGIKPHPAIELSEEERAAIRSACATRARDRGDGELALAFEAGSQDEGWAFRHEVNRLRAERAAA